MIQFGPGGNSIATCTGQVAQEFSYSVSVTPTDDPAIQDLQIHLARLDPAGGEKVVLVLSGPVARDFRSLPGEVEALLTSCASEPNCVDRTVERVREWAHSEQIRPHATLREFTAGSAPLDTLEQQLAFTTPQNPTEVKDRLTQFRTKAALYSREGMDEISRTIPGEKVLYGFDVRGVGEANRVGLGKEGVDAFFSQLGSLAKDAFGNIPFETFRLGGDEFAIILQNQGAPSIAAVRDFNAAAMQLRDSLLPLSDDRVQEAELRLSVRGRMRAVFSDYYTHDVSSRTAYIDRLLQKFEEGSEREAVIAKVLTADGHIDSGKLTLMTAMKGFEAGKHVEQSNRRVLDFVGCMVPITSHPDSMLVNEALGTIDKIIHRLKENPSSSADGIHELDPDIIVRAASRHSMEAVGNVSKEFEAALEDLSQKADFSGIDGLHAIVEQNNINAIDPEIGYKNRVLRLGLIHDSPISQILPEHFPCTYECFEVRLEPFGPLNNQLGSDRADDIFRAMSREMRELYPHAVLVRRNGGNLVVLTPNAGKLADLEDFERRVNNVMTGASGDRYERAVAEHEQRVALREFFGLVEEKGRAAVANANVAADDIRSAYQTLPIRVEFVSDPVRVTLQAQQTFGELFESLFG